MTFPDSFGTKPQRPIPQNFPIGIPYRFRPSQPGIAVVPVRQLFTEVVPWPRSFWTPNYIDTGSVAFSLDSAVPGVSVATANVLVGPYTATPPSLAVTAPSLSVATANVLVGPYTATPPSLGVTAPTLASVTATSP